MATEYGLKVMALGGEINEHGNNMARAAYRTKQTGEGVTSTMDQWQEASEAVQTAKDALSRLLDTLTTTEDGLTTETANLTEIAGKVGETATAVNEKLEGATGDLAAEALHATDETRSKADAAEEGMGRAVEGISTPIGMVRQIDTALDEVLSNLGEGRAKTTELGVIVVGAEIELREGVAAATEASEKLLAYGESK
jgi:ABC-type transporter Mla subunit MlaD